MLKRVLLFFMLLLLGTGIVSTLAQDTPAPLNAALADLSARVGRTVSLSEVEKWTFLQSSYPSPALGCPQPGVSYIDVVTGGFQFIITFAGTEYDYRVSNDQSIVILCGTAPAPASTPVCPPPDDPAYLLPRLSIGAQARVVAGDLPNLLRDQPGSSGQLLGEIPPGQVFVVQDGPRCSFLDKIIWWQVNFNGLIGWTAEGQDGDYWLEPLDLALTPTPTAIPDPQPIRSSNAAAVQQLYSVEAFGALFLNDRQFVVGAADGTVSLIDYRTNATLQQVQAHTAPVTSVAVGVNAATFITYIATASAEGQIRLWDVDASDFALRQIAELTGHTSAVTALTFSNRTDLLISGGEDGSVRLWNVSDGTPLATLGGHTAPVVNVAISTTAIISRDSTGRTIVWGVPTGLAG